MLVSVIVPTRNRPASFRETLEGIKHQLLCNIELIVIDDGSSEENSNLNKAHISDIFFDDCNYIYLPISNSQGNGPSHTRNLGINSAKGQLIAFCDDDDYWSEPEYLKTAIDSFSKDATLDIFFSNQKSLKNGELFREIWQPHLLNNINSRLTNDGEVITVSKAECLCAPGDFAHMNICVFRKSLLNDISGFWEAIRYAEDMDLFVRAVDAAKNIVYFNKTVSTMNVPDKSKKTSASTVLDLDQKAITLIHIGNHLINSCNTASSIKYGTKLAGDQYRRLSKQAATYSYEVAFIWGIQYLAKNPTLRWSLYMIYISSRSFLSKTKRWISNSEILRISK